MLLLKSFMNERSVDSAPCRFLPQQYKTSFTFIAHQGFHTQILAYMLDSLVRVSRRVNENHFVKIANARSSETPVTNRDLYRTLSYQSHSQNRRSTSSLAERIIVIPQAAPRLTSGYKFQLISLPIDYLPLLSSAKLPDPDSPPHTRTLTLALKFDRLYEIPNCPLTNAVSIV